MRAKPFSKQPTLVRSLRPFNLMHTNLFESLIRALDELLYYLALHYLLTRGCDHLIGRCRNIH
jgi:hypothetical protein